MRSRHPVAVVVAVASDTCAARPGHGALLQHIRRRGALVRAPLPGRGCGSAALMHARVDVRRTRVRLDVKDPTIVTNVRLRGTGEANNRGGEATGNHGGKSELLHRDAFFVLCLCRPFLTLLTALTG